MSKNRVVLLGAVLGVILLGLMAVFAIAIPKLHDDNSTITLPDTLPGGYTATDLPAAFKHLPSGMSSSQVPQIVKSEHDSVVAGDKALKDAYGAGRTRTYVHLTSASSTSIVVQAFHSEGGAFAPLSMTDAATAKQQGGDVLVTADDVVCDQHMAADQTSGSVSTAYYTCQDSENGLTVQVTSQSESLSAAVGLTKRVYQQIAS